MIIAQQKRKENIAEYLIYMYQIEDMIRASEFDIDIIDQRIISGFDQPYSVKRDMREWYLSLIQMMKDNGVEQKGHIPLLQSILEEVDNLHIRLLNRKEDTEYTGLYEKAKPAIEELRVKSGDNNVSDVELGLNGLYGLLILRLKQRTLNPETEKAFGYIGEWLAGLSLRFRKLEQGESEI